MSFRRGKNSALAWSNWLNAHRGELVECGLPDFVLADVARWMRFVEHGIDGETGFVPEMLPPPQLKRLQLFLAREYPSNSLPIELRLPPD